MSNWFLILPSGLWAFLVTALGRWGEHRFSLDDWRSQERLDHGVWARVTGMLFVNLLFFGALPAFVLFIFQPMVPFEADQAGLALGLSVYVLGLVPARLLDASRRGWDHAAWMMFIDFLRTVGALSLAGWLLQF